MSSKLLKMIILGPPGSGKGTISSRIKRDFPIKHLSSGDLFRSQIREGTEIGKKASAFIEKGQLVPDDITVNLMTAEIKNTYKNQSWLLDGFPRTLAQAKELSKQEDISLVISLCVPDDEIMERIKQRWIHEPSGRVYNLQFQPPKNKGVDDVTGEPLIQRNDDKPETVKARLTNYHNLVDPLLEYYKEKNLLQIFYGTQTNKIWPEVHLYLNKYIPSHSGPF